MKKNVKIFVPGGRGRPKIKKAKQLFFFVFSFLFLQVSATSFSQKSFVKLDVQKTSIKEVFQIISSQSEFTFIFNEEDIAQVEPITLDLQDGTVEDVMDRILQGSGLSWEMVDEVIVIKPSEKIAVQTPKKVSVKGQVVDDLGEPIPGVSVFVVGQNHGTITDMDGNYKLEVSGEDITLSFSFIGFTTQHIKLDGKTTVNVRLKTEVSEIEDVVVVGYFEQKQESFTGAATTISSEELLQANNQNILQAIQLVDPSFVKVENSIAGSNPNVMPDFQIRGSANIDMKDEYQGSPNMPTFILDGFEVDVEKIYDLDPYRVKSVTILKDAAATAIYGSRAANGVVVIETVSPKPGKMSVSYRGDFTFTGADLSDYDLLNAAEKLEVEKKAGLYDATGLVSYIEQLKNRYNNKLRLVQQGYNTYWLNKPVEKLSLSNKHHILLEGGAEGIRYAIDFNYNDENGVMKGSGRDRVGIGLKLQYNFKNLIIRNKLTYDNVKGVNSPYGPFSTYAKMNPYYRYTDDMGNYLYVLDAFDYEKVYNPLYNTTLNIVDENGYDNVVENLDLDWRISDTWRIKGAFSFDKGIQSSDEFIPGTHTSFANQSDLSKRGRYTTSRGESIGYEANVVVNYFKAIKKHVINGNTILNINQKTSKRLTIIAQGFPNEDMSDIAFAMQYQEGGKPSATESTSRLAGISGNINYSYDNRLLCDLSFRTDASSSFGSDKRWGSFWSVGFGWNIHKEKFAENCSWVNTLKLRGSVGSTGSVSFNPYQAMMMYRYNTDAIHRFETGAVLMGLGNKNLAWQETIKKNLGLDFLFFDKRVSGSINYYNDVSKALLVNVDLAPSLGFSSYKENLGDSKNEGIELALRYNIFTNKRGVTWSVHGNLAHNKNTLLKLSDALTEFNSKQDEEITNPKGGEKDLVTRPRVRYVEGHSTTVIWANKSLGIDPISGKEIFVTKDGGTTLIWDADNMTACGDTEPDFQGNFGTNFSYKKFSLNVIFRYRVGGQYYNQTLVDRVENANPWYNVDRRFFEKRWEKPGDITFYKDVKNKESTKPTSRFIQDYNFLELASINASYELSPEIAQKLRLKRLKMVFYVNDIFRTSSVKAERGIDYPFARSFSVGVQGRF